MFYCLIIVSGKLAVGLIADGYCFLSGDKACVTPECLFNPFTLRVPQDNIVCYFHTFENNLEIKQILSKYLKESGW